MIPAPVSLYIHFPWCVRKCPYCDFNSHPVRDGGFDEGAYVDALLEDLASQLEGQRAVAIGTVFCGGGTPSLFSAEAYARLLTRLDPLLTPDAEVSMEANPGTTEHHDFGAYRSAGINRLSFGAQSFDNDKLKALGRIHDSSAIYQSYELARAAGFDNINLDIMYGLPRQTRSQALADLDAACALGPEHLSWYQLTLEPKTEFARRPPPLPSDIILESIEQQGHAHLAARGFERYEVSAYSQPGRQCRHNLQYWSFGDYLGVGAGAHGKLSDQTPAGTTRTRKAHQPRVYLERPTVTLTDSVTVDQLPGEFMMNALRLTEGVELAQFSLTTGLPLSALEPARSRQIADGLLAADRLAATERGYPLLDSLIADYL